MFEVIIYANLTPKLFFGEKMLAQMPNLSPLKE